MVSGHKLDFINQLWSKEALHIISAVAWVNSEVFVLRRWEPGACIECQAYCSQMGQQPGTVSREQKQRVQARMTARLEHVDKVTQAERKWSKGSSDGGGLGGLQGRPWDSLKCCWEAQRPGAKDHITGSALHNTISALSVYNKSKGTNNKAKGPARGPL